MQKLLVILFVSTVILLLSGCGNSCDCDDWNHFIIEIDGKILRSSAGSMGTKLVTKQEREHLINRHRELDQETFS